MFFIYVYDWFVVNMAHRSETVKTLLDVFDAEFVRKLDTTAIKQQLDSNWHVSLLVFELTQNNAVECFELLHVLLGSVIQ
jgi:hypothetical protein